MRKDNKGLDEILPKGFHNSSVMAKQRFSELLKVFLTYWGDVGNTIQMHPTVDTLRAQRTQMSTQTQELNIFDYLEH